MKQLRRLLLSLFAPQLASVIGASFTLSSDGSWFDQLDKPWFNPPGWVFGPVWTVLYLLMGVASYLVWRQRSPWYSRSLTFYWIQLVLNAMWSPFFFGLQSPLLGMVIIIPMLILVGICVYAFWLRSKIASIMMMPYFVWLLFATALNVSIYWLNR